MLHVQWLQSPIGPVELQKYHNLKMFEGLFSEEFCPIIGKFVSNLRNHGPWIEPFV
jgi:hypothetical protein